MAGGVRRWLGTEGFSRRWCLSLGLFGEGGKSFVGDLMSHGDCCCPLKGF